MNASSDFTTVDEYIKAFPKDVRVRLDEIRQAIRKAAPEAVETISYQMPTYKLNVKNLVHFAGWKSHIGFYPTPSATQAFKKEIAKYKASKGSVQFPLDEPLPLPLILRIVKFRVAECAKLGKKAPRVKKRPVR